MEVKNRGQRFIGFAKTVLQSKVAASCMRRRRRRRPEYSEGMRGDRAGGC